MYLLNAHLRPMKRFGVSILIQLIIEHQIECLRAETASFVVEDGHNGSNERSTYRQ